MLHSGGPQVSVLAPFYVHNRRDGSRLLSSALVIFCVAITQLNQSWAVVVAAISAIVCLYWGFAYRNLER
ncbi:MAG: hypothetical protein CBD37_06750 [Cyanobacteria bacterium TMED177]|nr:MAG: hypothetical protein CBD37_06750 [Cyanobacteria bacterium TMED177]